MTLVGYINPAAVTGTAPSFTIPSTAQVGDKVALLLTQNNSNVITGLPSSNTASPAGDWTQQELDTTTSSSFPTSLYTFTVDTAFGGSGGAFVAGSTYHFTLSASRACTILGVVERGVDASGTWFAFASNGAVQSTTAGNQPTLNTATALGSANVDIYEAFAVKSNGTATTAFGIIPVGFSAGASVFTSQTTFGGNEEVIKDSSNPVASGTYGGEARANFGPNGVWNVVKGYVFAFKQGASDTAPTANAGPDQSNVEPYSLVTLDGTGSSDPDSGDTITYAWTQTGGTTAALSDATAAQPTLTAPGTIAGTTLVYSLVTTDSHGVASTADSVSIVVLPVTERAVVGGVEVAARILYVGDATVVPTGPAELVSSVPSNTPNDQTSTSLAVDLGAAVANDLRIVVLSGSCAVGGVGADPGITTPSGWAKMGQIVDSNSGTGTQSSFIAVYQKKNAGETSQTFTWTNPSNLIAETLRITGQNPTAPVGTLFTHEESDSDGTYTISGTTDIKGRLVSVFANRNSSTAWSGLPDDDAGSNSNSPSGPTMAIRITTDEVDAGTAFTKTATGTNTSIGTEVAFVVAGTD